MIILLNGKEKKLLNKNEWKRTLRTTMNNYRVIANSKINLIRIINWIIGGIPYTAHGAQITPPPLF